MLAEYVTQWIALGFLFLLASSFSERTAKYGYVLIPIIAGLFAYIGWLGTSYLSTIVPLLLGIGVITFLKEQFRVKLGGYGSSGSLIWRIFSFMIILQFAIVMVNSMGIYESNKIVSPDAETTSTFYSLQKLAPGSTDPLTGAYTSQTNLFNTAWFFGEAIMTGFLMLWTLLLGTLGLWWTLTGLFKLPASVAYALSGIVYLMFVIEIYIVIFKP